MGILAATLICAERAHSFAQSAGQPAQSAPGSAAGVGASEKIDLGVIAPDRDEESPEAIRESQIPLSEKGLRKFDTIRTKEQICKLVEGKIVVYYDTISLVKSCIQRPIEDAEFFNDLVNSEKKEVVELPGRLYKLIPFGEPYTRNMLAGKDQKTRPTELECGEIEGKYVTGSGITYYFIENCKKRAFQRFYDLQEHNKTKTTIVSIDPALLNRIPTGKVIALTNNDDDKLLMKMDGDVKWSLLARSNRGGEMPKDDAESLKKIQNQKSSANPSAPLCQKFDNRLVSFYSQIFFLKGCELRKVTDFGIKLQQKVQLGDPIIDLSSEEYRSLKSGKNMETKDLLVFLNQKEVQNQSAASPVASPSPSLAAEPSPTPVPNKIP